VLANNTEGFSLLEVLVSILLASFLFLLIFNANFNYAANSRLKTASLLMDQNANTVLNYLHKKISSAGANLAADNSDIISGQNATDIKHNDSISYGFKNMLDCAGTRTVAIKYEKLTLNGSQLRCDGNGGLKPGPQPMLDEIAALQFLYGVDTDNDYSVNQYQPAHKVTDWRQVRSIQAGLVLRSQNKIFSKKRPKTHKVLDHSFVTNDRYLYRKYSLNLNLRNRLPSITKTQ